MTTYLDTSIFFNYFVPGFGTSNLDPANVRQNYGTGYIPITSKFLMLKFQDCKILCASESDLVFFII